MTTNRTLGLSKIVYKSGYKYRLEEDFTFSLPPLQVFEIGDRIDKLTPAVGQPLGWVCTTGGAGGASIFTPLANL